jgi:hypothetical protein
MIRLERLCIRLLWLASRDNPPILLSPSESSCRLEHAYRSRGAVRENEGREVPPVAVWLRKGATRCPSSSLSTAPWGGGINTGRGKEVSRVPRV